MKIARFVFRVVKGIYDILASYLFLHLLPLIALSVGLHFGLEYLVQHFGFEHLSQSWSKWSYELGVRDWILRLAVFLPVHAAFWWLISRPFKVVLRGIDAAFDKVYVAYAWAAAKVPKIKTPVEVGFSVFITVLLVPFLIQPTLVAGWGANSWGERAANLVDGTAVVGLHESVIGLYRQIYAEPVVVDEGVSSDAVDTAVDVAELIEPVVPPIPMGDNPMMDRWDPIIMRSAKGDAERFATIKAFMWVESAGRQFAVSHTGCAGLMQFCAPTAKSGPFKDIFGVGQVYTCGCQTKDCRIPRNVQKDLESGIRERIEMHRGAFPCKLTDARFNPERSIAAGAAYVESLHNQFSGNIYLMYIGYNSGPAVAKRAWLALGQNPNASLEEIDAVLVQAMQPTYGAGSAARARSLVRTHLPKLAKAKASYLKEQTTLLGSMHRESNATTGTL